MRLGGRVGVSSGWRGDVMGVYGTYGLGTIFGTSD